MDEERKKALIRHIARIGMVRWSEKPVTFKSRRKSHVYVSGREELTGDADALWAVGEALAHAAFMAMPSSNLTARKKLVLIGIPTAGTPLAVAASLAWRSLLSDTCIVSRTMRTEKKAHGRAENQRWVDGDPRDDELYYTVDNVITDGASKLEAIERLRRDGYPVEKMVHIIVIDRLEGGIGLLRDAGHYAIGLLTLPDVVKALVQEGDWPRTRLKRYRAEIEEYMAQFDR